MQAILSNYFRAGFPCVAIQTPDESRAQGDVIAAAKDAGKRIMTWSVIEGLVNVSGGDKPVQDTNDLTGALSEFMKKRNADETRGEQATVLILRDPHTFPWDRDPGLCRMMKDALAAAGGLGSTVVVLAHEFRPHPTFEKMVVVLDYELPTLEELTKVANDIQTANAAEMEQDKCGPLENVVRALSGLTINEAENALALSIIEKKCFCPKVIYREKVKAVKRSGLLDVIEPDPRGLEAIGGLEGVKTWIKKRRRHWTPEARAKKVKAPKGMMLVGLPGTGKSLTAKVVGTVLEQPTLKFSIDKLFNSLVGESERITRETLALAEAMSPCILWVDEIDKGLAGTGGSGSGDSGVGKRVLGIIITWMQERKKPVFVIATANDVTNLDSALLRKGRFDEIFAVDLPTKSEREAIFAIQLAARGMDASALKLDRFADATENFTGSEIEAVVDEALTSAFDADRDMEPTDVMKAAAETIPLAVTSKEQIENMRTWVAGRAKPASGPAPAKEAAAPRRVGRASSN